MKDKEFTVSDDCITFDAAVFAEKKQGETNCGKIFAINLFTDGEKSFDEDDILTIQPTKNRKEK